MFELTEAYDDLLTLRHAVAISEGLISKPATDELQVLLKFTEARIYVALHALSEEVIEGLDSLYENEARSGLMTTL